MAKGDSNAAQSAIDKQGGTAQSLLNLQTARNSGMYGGMAGNYNTGVGMNLPDYSNVMSSYQNFLSGGNPTGVSPNPAAGTPIPTGNYPPGTAIPRAGETPPGGGTGGRGGTGLPSPGATSLDKLNMGNLSDPTTWMNMVGNDQQRTNFVKQIMGPGASDDLINYYSDKIKGQPGANPTEQAGSAQYWMNKMLADPMFGGSQSGSSSGGGPAGAISGWQNMAATGGFSPQDIQDLRARAIAPVRAAFQTAQDNIERQRALGGGYSPGYTAAEAKMAREKAYGMSDAETNANAAIAGMKQSGMISGLQGLTGAQLGALSGMTGMYGTNPALSSTFGNQVLAAGSQGLQGASLQNQLADSIMRAQIAKAGIPGNWQSAMGNIAAIGPAAGAIGTVAGAL